MSRSDSKQVSSKKISLKKILSQQKTKQNEVIQGQIELRRGQKNYDAIFEYEFLGALQKARGTSGQQALKTEDTKQEGQKDKLIFNAKFECYLSSDSETLKVRAKLLSQILESEYLTQDKIAIIMRQSKENLPFIIEQLEADRKIIVLSKIHKFSQDPNWLKKYELMDFQFKIFSNETSIYSFIKDKKVIIEENQAKIEENKKGLNSDIEELQALQGSINEMTIQNNIKIFLSLCDTVLSGNIEEDQKTKLQSITSKKLFLNQNKESKSVFSKLFSKKHSQKVTNQPTELVNKIADKIQNIIESDKLIKTLKSAIAIKQEQNLYLETMTEEQIQSITDLTARIETMREKNIVLAKQDLLNKIYSTHNPEEKKSREDENQQEIVGLLKFIISNSEKSDQQSEELASYLQKILSLPYLNNIEILNLLISNIGKIPESYFAVKNKRDKVEDENISNIGKIPESYFAVKDKSNKVEDENILDRCIIGLIVKTIQSTKNELLIAKLILLLENNQSEEIQQEREDFINNISLGINRDMFNRIILNNPSLLDKDRLIQQIFAKIDSVNEDVLNITNHVDQKQGEGQVKIKPKQQLQGTFLEQIAKLQMEFLKNSSTNQPSSNKTLSTLREGLYNCKNTKEIIGAIDIIVEIINTQNNEKLTESILEELTKKEIFSIVDKIKLLKSLSSLDQNMIAMSENYTKLINQTIKDFDLDLNRYLIINLSEIDKNTSAKKISGIKNITGKINQFISSDINHNIEHKNNLILEINRVIDLLIIKKEIKEYQENNLLSKIRVPADPDEGILQCPLYKNLTKNQQQIVSQILQDQKESQFTCHPFDLLTGSEDISIGCLDNIIRLVAIRELVNLYNTVIEIDPKKVNLLDKNLITTFINKSKENFGELNIDERYRNSITGSLENSEQTFKESLETIIENCYKPLLRLESQQSDRGSLFQKQNLPTLGEAEAKSVSLRGVDIKEPYPPREEVTVPSKKPNVTSIDTAQSHNNREAKI